MTSLLLSTLLAFGSLGAWPRDLACGSTGNPRLAKAPSAIPPPPPAQDKPAFLYEQGTGHYRAGLFRQAIGEFLEADRLRPNPVLAYDVAQTYEKLGDPEHAAQYYRIYLERFPGAPDRPVVEATLRNLDSWIGARHDANQDPGAGFRKIGFYSLAAGAGAGAIGFIFQVSGDGDAKTNLSGASALHTTADFFFVAGAVGLVSAGFFFLLGTTNYATHQSAIAVLPGPGGFALSF